MKDYMFMSKNTTFDKIKKLLSNGKVVICDIHDRNGKIGLKIKSIENNFENEKCDMTMTNDEKYSLEDRFLYNLVFNQKRGEYSLQTQDEFYEKIPVKN
jgi:predicted RNA-binding protein with RPS1 domain